MRICDRNYLNLDKVDGLHEPWLRRQQTGVEDSASCRDDLATTAMDGNCVEGDVVDVEPNAAKILVAENALKMGSNYGLG